MPPVAAVRERRDWDDRDRGSGPTVSSRAIFGRAMCCRGKLRVPDRMDGPDREPARCRAPCLLPA